MAKYQNPNRPVHTLQRTQGPIHCATEAPAALRPGTVPTFWQRKLRTETTEQHCMHPAWPLRCNLVYRGCTCTWCFTIVTGDTSPHPWVLRGFDGLQMGMYFLKILCLHCKCIDLFFLSLWPERCKIPTQLLHWIRYHK
jgi:hypothetical protein